VQRIEGWKREIKSFKEVELVLWMFKATKIKGGKFTLPWKGPFKIQKMFDNNTWSYQP
jgi:hypothetical protein